MNVSTNKNYGAGMQPLGEARHYRAQQPSQEEAVNAPQTQDQENAQPASERSIPSAEVPKPKPEPWEDSGMGGGSLKKIIVGIVIIVVVALAGYYAYTFFSTPPTPCPQGEIYNATTRSCQHLPVRNTTNTYLLSGCTDITAPGTYYLNKSFSTQISEGACINIKSSNVRILGNGNNVSGNGPFIAKPPYTYGVQLNDFINVTVQDLNINKFSYNIYLNGTSRSNIINTTTENATISNIYLYKAANNTFRKAQVYGNSGLNGAFVISGGGDNYIGNSLILTNIYIGLSINSTGNKVVNTTIINNPIDIICGDSFSLRNLNTFSHSTCNVNDNCNFAYCSLKNTPYNISTLRLSHSVKTCGSIYTPGTYNLQGDLSLTSYINLSNPLSRNLPCITIKAPDVRLDCRGNGIRNAPYGILTKDLYNVSIVNCRLENDTYGIDLTNIVDLNVKNTSIIHSLIGLLLFNSSVGTISNVTASNNTYGVYTNASSAIVFNNVTATGNNYGVYYTNSDGENFNNGQLLSNSRDLYCTADTYNSTSNLFHGVRCGNTDCDWGVTCPNKFPPPLSVFSIPSCEVITAPGTYLLNKNLLVPEYSPYGNNCIVVRSDNVDINCNNNIIEGNRGGNGIYIYGQSNITVANCTIKRFYNGINVNNTDYVKLSNMIISNSTNSVIFENAYHGDISRITAIPMNVGFLLNNIHYSKISYNNASNGVNRSVGFEIANSDNNIISNNTAFNNQLYGFALINSRNNTINQNTAFASASSDYYCSGSSSGPYAESDGIDTGLTKTNCQWLLEKDPHVQPQQCYIISSSAYVRFSQDLLYPYGKSCYNVFNTKASSADAATIDCAGHTVLATNGGTFANVVNSSNVKIENCVLKGFTTAIVSTAKGTSLINDTIVSSNVSVMFKGVTSALIQGNRILNASYGVYLQNGQGGSIRDNFIRDAKIGINIVGGNNYNLVNNSAQRTTIGLYISNSTLNTLQNNLFLNASASGISCVQGSGSLNYSTDGGGNICSSNSQCLWMKSSPRCRSS